MYGFGVITSGHNFKVINLLFGFVCAVNVGYWNGGAVIWHFIGSQLYIRVCTKTLFHLNL